MKKAIGILLICVLLFGLTSCAGGMSVAPTTTEIPTEPPLTEVELAAKYSLEYLKAFAKNPESLQVHEIKYIYGYTYSDGESYDYIFSVDISSQNGFGGMNREVYYLYYKSNGTVEAIKYFLMLSTDNYIDPERIGF